MRWLHLSDLHIGNNNESQEVALSSLVNAVHEFSKDQTFDLVLITGDLAFSGKKEEYDRFEELVLAPLRSSNLFSNAKILSVPGNHDVDCDSVLPVSWGGLGSSRQDRFFHSNSQGQSIRKPRAPGFEAYSHFIKKNEIDGVDPLVEPASLLSLTFGGKRINFLTTVTAFFSDKEVTDERLTPAPLHAIRYLLKDQNKADHLVILGHHPKDWFTRDTVDPFWTLLVKQYALYLHGHLHRTQVSHGNLGLVTLGFGAVYQAPSDRPLSAYYRNSMAICELDESLHIAVISWDAEQGRWQKDSSLPPEFEAPSNKLENGYILPLPSTKYTDPTARRLQFLRVEHKAEHCLWLAKDNNKAWSTLLQVLGYISQASKPYLPAPSIMPPGHTEFRLVDDDGYHLIHAVSAHGDLINYEQVERANTQLDTSAFKSCIIITLGEIAQDARELANRLVEKKPIKVVDGELIAEELLNKLSSSLNYVLNEFEPRETNLTLLIHDDGVGALIVDRLHKSWFKVFSPTGQLLPEASEIVFSLREAQPILKRFSYSEVATVDSNVGKGADGEVLFNRETYLKTCYSHFNDIKYAPLAALGFKFSNASLKDMYIPANAGHSAGNKSAESMERAVSEFIDALNIDSSQKDQLERQLRISHGLGTTSEVGAAQKLYRKFGNILVLGDPGSGKTCFVKHEILLYSSPTQHDSFWYAKHLPVFLPLAEAARLLSDNQDLLPICSVIGARYMLNIPVTTLHHMLGEGRLAFFFDGLDEVGSIEERIQLLSMINDLMSKYGRLGNRFVVTSRPAAIQPIDIPEGLTHIQLKGLSEQEIRVLASRVVASRLQEDSTASMQSEEKELVDRLMDDCEQTPGIRRIARNPLLLTLLVLVYANSGALFARRHVVYSQAVKTLISVRNRSLKTQVLSESDLRNRLGVLAYAIFNRTIGEIPQRSEVRELLTPHVEAEQGEGLVTADKFLQEVAEATGILIIHQRGTAIEDDVISFMHYSFLEYYAAIGLLHQEFQHEVPRLVKNPRWREILTLMFGILSEQKDITDLLARISQEQSNADKITKKRLVFSMDCALECDVPPERAQKLLMNLIVDAIISGPARISLELRIEIAKRLSQLLLNTGSPYIIARLIQGMLHNDPCVSAAFVDLVAHLDSDLQIDQVGLDAFEHAFQRPESVVRCACAEALQSKPELRTEKAIEQLRKCLNRGFLEKHVALKTIEVVHGLMDPLRKEVIELLSDSKSIISGAAARCILASGIFDSPEIGDRPILDKALRVWQFGTQPRIRSKTSVWVNNEYIEELISSDDAGKKELGIRYLSLVERQEIFVYRLIISTLKDTTNHRVKTACLQALRQSPDSLALVTLADVDFVTSLLGANERDVRIESIRVLEDFPSDDQIISALLRHLDHCSAENKITSDEAEETMRALTTHANGRSELRSILIDRILKNYRTKIATSYGGKKEQEILRQSLKACEELGGTIEYRLALQLLDTANDYRAPKEIRRQSLKTYGKLVEPSPKSASDLLAILESKDRVLRHARYDAILSYVKKCRGKVAYVRAIYKNIPCLSSALCKAWNSEYKQVNDRIDHRTLGNLRKCVIELEDMLTSYEEFAKRVTVATPEEQGLLNL
ncbi:MAG: metallophosphoesterase [Sedimenticola sp.]